MKRKTKNLNTTNTVKTRQDLDNETGEKKLWQEEYSDILYTAANIMIRDHGLQLIDLPPQESGPQH